MKILFIYPTIGNLVEYQFGIAGISALLKKKGHRTNLLRINVDISKKLLIKIIKKINPDVIAFSFVTNHGYYVKKYSSFIKQEFKKPIIAGGIHATISPEEVIQWPSIDVVCIGEGEYPMLEFIEALEKKKDYSKINNLWVKRGNKIIKNDLRPLIQDLNALPFGDRTIFYGNKKKIRELYIMAGRGCPYDCTYCCNHLLRKIYSNCGKYVRMRSVDNVLEEIKQNMKKYEFDIVTFEDDTFTLFKNWLKELGEKYPKLISKPFSCNARVENIDEELLNILKKAGCVHIGLGIESGNEWLRMNVLKRRMTNEQTIKAFNLIKKHNLSVGTYYIIGFPYESSKMIEDTIKMHKTVRPTGGFQVTIFYPYPHTELYEMCKKENLLTSKRKDTFGAGFIGAGGYSTLNFSVKHLKQLKKYYWRFLDFQYKENDFGHIWVKTHHNFFIYLIYRFLSMFIGPSKAFMLLLSFKKLFIKPVFIN